MMAPRCYLFVPGDRADMLDKAARRGADALIIDLEDAVAAQTRSASFESVATWLRDRGPTDLQTWVRFPREFSSEDAAPVISAGITGAVVAKAGSADEVERIREAIAPANSEAKLIVLIETAHGLQHVDAIAAVPGVVRLMSGEIDMAAELGIDLDDPLVWWPIRSRIVVASAAAGLAGPIGPVSPDFSDPIALEAAARLLRRHGFRAGAAIHPRQIQAYVRGYGADPEEMEAARQVIALYEAALADGRGAVIDEAGHMVDEAVVKRARRLLQEG